MSKTQPTGTGDWRVRVGVWIEQRMDFLAGGRLELLEAIDRCQSISAAARAVGVSFRHAWATVRQITEAAGEPLVTASAGGSHGGGAALTDQRPAGGAAAAPRAG
ncbi:MAG: LysR family transcriptional regulator [Gemmataceae bacterium]